MYAAATDQMALLHASDFCSIDVLVALRSCASLMLGGICGTVAAFVLRPTRLCGTLVQIGVHFNLINLIVLYVGCCIACFASGRTSIVSAARSPCE